MNFQLFDFINKLLGRKMSVAARQERLLRTALSVRSYSRLSIQEKIILLARMIDRFECDYGFVPEALEKALLTLNKQLTRIMCRSFEVSKGQSATVNSLTQQP